MGATLTVALRACSNIDQTLCSMNRWEGADFAVAHRVVAEVRLLQRRRSQDECVADPVEVWRQAQWGKSVEDVHQGGETARRI